MGKNNNSPIAKNGSKAKKKKGLKKGEEDSPKNYKRIGTGYYKKSSRRTRYGWKRETLKNWNLQTLKEDFPSSTVRRTIEKFDDFVVVPDNLRHKRRIGNCYNLYFPFPYKWEKGEWKVIRRFLKHVFGNQYDEGIKYLQALFLYPKKRLPILVLVSKGRETGKTTFIELVLNIFGNNAILINSQTFESDFNFIYISKNIICIDEACFAKKGSVEKLKSLSTASSVLVNNKYVVPYPLDFFGKFIIASNNEDNFLDIEKEEIRYWVRRLGPIEKKDTKLLKKMIKEIPAFLYHLKEMPELDWSKSRQLFTPEELSNESLSKVVEESRSYAYKELKESFMELFDNNDIEDELVYASLTDIKDRFFLSNHKIDRVHIKKALRDEFRFKYEGLCRYTPFGLEDMPNKSGRAWVIEKKFFVDE